MTETTAIVTRYAEGQAWIKAQTGNACGGCRQRTNCGTVSLTENQASREWKLACQISVRPGDLVRVSIDDSGLLWASCLAYLLPLLVMLITVIGCDRLLPQSSEFLPIVALSGLGLGGWLSHLWQNRDHWQKYLQPRIVGKC